MFRRVPCRILIAAHRQGRFLTANTIATISQALLDRATTPRSDSPVSQCADDRYRREDIGEHPGRALDQPLERHALMEIYSVLHDEVLVAGMKNLWIDRGHDLDGEIISPDDADLKAREPARAFEADARRAIIEGAGFCIPARSMAGAHENHVARCDRLFVTPWRSRYALRSASAISSPTSRTRPFRPWTSNRTPRVKKGRAFSIPSFLSACGDHISESRLPS